MSKIVKCFIFVFFMCSIFGSSKYLLKVKAESFYEAEYIDNIWITKEKGGAHLYQKARFFRNKVTGKESYCLDPFVFFNESGYYESNTNYSKLSADTVNKIKLAAYYGYGYTNHTDIKWYAITQVLIWKYAVPDGNFYFTDGLDGNRINSFDNDINSLINLVNNHYKAPSFNGSTNKVIIGNTLTINDNNNVLSNYEITNNGGLEVTKNNNKLIVKANKIGSYIINLKKTANKASGLPIFYTSSTSQDMLSRGNVDNVSSYLKVNVEGGYITINKHDDDNNSCIAQGEASLDGAIYEIYNENNNLVDTLTINNCTSKSIGLPYGNYIVKEKSPGIGYYKDNNSYNVTINSNNSNITLNLTNKVIKSYIEINKLYGSNEDKDYKVEPNIEFGVYDTKNNLINIYKTDLTGYVSFYLPYGNYIIKQLNSTTNYDKVNDIYLTIDENSDKKITYVLKNNLLTSKLKVVKKDKYSNKNIINKNAKFKIKNMKTGKYLSHLVNGEISYIFEIDNNGYFITDIKLEFGKYSIEEIVSPSGYKRLNKNIIFEINEDSKFELDELGNKIFELVIYNEKEDIVIKVPDTSSNFTYNIFNLFIKGLYEEKKKIYSF